jgi:hypothetical protein
MGGIHDLISRGVAGMGRWLALSLGLFLLAACGATPTPDVVATEVAVARAVAATLTAEAPAAAADMVATQVAAARFAAATLTAEAASQFPTATPPISAGSSQAPVEEQVGRDLGRGLGLVMEESQGEDQSGVSHYVWAPRMTGPEQPVTENFQRAVDGFVTYALDDFRQGVAELAGEPGSGIWITHTVTAATGGLLSVIFYVDGYVMGAAHPFHYSYALNYSLDRARILGLDDLFLSGSNYLEVLSTYCLEDLARQGVLAWEEGVQPAPENYQRWNVTPEGLLVSFDEYTVAPYAAGPQAVVVPYALLKEIIDAGGPLALFTDQLDSE